MLYMRITLERSWRVLTDVCVHKRHKFIVNHGKGLSQYTLCMLGLGEHIYPSIFV